ncbi:S8 family serine peptidase [Micromonospora sp. NPDC004551]|uniref:S8 family serine peptidase n=1 Tax=Micromonospora sp. NPDC004551 TaxID=3154284 RepID=UPI0033A66B96
MRQLRRLSVAGLTAVVLYGTTAASWAAPAGGAGGTAPLRSEMTTRAGGGRPATVTLLTGDRVTITGEALSVRPGAGRTGMRFLVRREGGRVQVVPHDVDPLIRDGKVDRRLFDVTELIRSGYDDASAKELPLLVSYRAGARRTAVTGARTTRDLPAIAGAAVVAPKARATSVWAMLSTKGSGQGTDLAPEVSRIWLDGRRQVLLDRSVPQIGAPAAYQAGYTGRGVSVAVLDSGVDTGHPDLAGRVVEARDFTGGSEAVDRVGHGTHVASIIAGSGAASGGRYRGVAPDATLLSGRVCTDFCSESAILAGMHWAAVEKHARVVNLSVGGPDTPDLDPLEQAVDSLTAQTGTLFVVAAGNDGELAPVGSPASADAALAVGAVDRDDHFAAFSSRGPRTGDGGIKPDLTAPGVEIVAARAAGTTLGNPVGDKYVAVSGTSMATPHVTGAVALLAQQHPDWSAPQFKAALMASAAAQAGQTVYQQGAGRVDVARAIGQTLTAEPAGISFGRALWPHADDTPITRTLTYLNSGPTDLGLDLSAEVTGPDGVRAPDGMFRFTPERVTVPAGGRAAVTVTVDTRVGGPDGLFSGRLVARAGATVAGTPIAVEKEVESYQLTLTHLDRSGTATADYHTSLVGLDGYLTRDPYDADGTVELRLPKGRYGLASSVWTGAGDTSDVSLLAQPELVLTGDTHLTVDARRAKPIRMTVPEPSAAPVLADLSAVFLPQNLLYGFAVTTETFSGVFSGQLGAAVPADEFLGWVSGQWAHSQAPNSPYLYAVSETVSGRMPTGFSRDYRTGDLATVTQRFHGAPGQAGERAVFPELSFETPAPAASLPTALPGRRIEYHNSGVRWSSRLDIGVPTADGWLDWQEILQSAPTGYRAGRTYRDTWHRAPFGPSFAALGWPASGTTRLGDTLQVDLSLHGDAAGHPSISRTTSARTALYRNGKLVGETTEAGYGSFPVAPDPGSYLLETRATRTFTDLSTEVSASWTFESGHADGGTPVRLPLMVVRFEPRLDGGEAVAAGQTLDLPVRVERQPGSPRADVAALTVQVSYDGGANWQDAPLSATPDGWTARVRHDVPGHVSLRASATDTAGGTVTEQIINAYRVR